MERLKTRQSNTNSLSSNQINKSLAPLQAAYLEIIFYTREEKIIRRHKRYVITSRKKKELQKNSDIYLFIARLFLSIFVTGTAVLAIAILFTQ